MSFGGLGLVPQLSGSARSVPWEPAGLEMAGAWNVPLEFYKANLPKKWDLSTGKQKYRFKRHFWDRETLGDLDLFLCIFWWPFLFYSPNALCNRQLSLKAWQFLQRAGARSQLGLCPDHAGVLSMGQDWVKTPLGWWISQAGPVMTSKRIRFWDVYLELYEWSLCLFYFRFDFVGMQPTLGLYKPWDFTS